MEILSHRGYWLHASEKNTVQAFLRSFELGFGTETDVRDSKGKLVISHDPPQGGELLFNEFLELYVKLGRPGFLALNIKADGLGALIKNSLERYQIQRYFLFDMSIPTLRGSLQLGLTCFTRQSEYEKAPLGFYSQVQGVWLDCFEGDWIQSKDVLEHLEKGKSVCIVSAELHKRSHLEAWKSYKELANKASALSLMLCTDFPLEARKFFYGKPD